MQQLEWRLDFKMHAGNCSSIYVAVSSQPSYFYQHGESMKPVNDKITVTLISENKWKLFTSKQ